MKKLLIIKNIILLNLLQKKIIPNFLVDKNKSPENLKDLLNGLKLVSDYSRKIYFKT